MVNRSPSSPRERKGLIQPAVQCRGREYLPIKQFRYFGLVLGTRSTTNAPHLTKRDTNGRFPRATIFRHLPSAAATVEAGRAFKDGEGHRHHYLIDPLS